MPNVTIQTNEIRADNGQRIFLLDGLLAYETAPVLASMQATDIVCVQNLYDAINLLSAAPLIFSLAANQGPVYTLSLSELAAVNGFNRYANFGAFINGARSYGITEEYTGAPGSFTAITVNWDGIDPIEVQFS